MGLLSNDWFNFHRKFNLFIISKQMLKVNILELWNTLIIYCVHFLYICILFNPNKSPYFIFHRNRKKNYPKIHMESQKTPDAQNNLSKKDSAGGLPDPKIYYRTIVIKTIWCCQKNRHVDQWNKIEGSSMSTHKMSHLIFGKDRP